MINYIMRLIDQGNPLILVLVDLHATLDTVDIHVIYSRLSYTFIISVKVIELFRSYL